MLRSNSPQVRPRRLRNSSFSARSFAASSWRSLRFSASSATKLERSSLDDPADGAGALCSSVLPVIVGLLTHFSLLQCSLESGLAVFVAFSIEARMEARWAGVYLLRLFSTGGVAAGAAFEAALAAFWSGCGARGFSGRCCSLAGLGSAFAWRTGFLRDAYRLGGSNLNWCLVYCCNGFVCAWYASPDRCLEIHLGVKNTGQWLM